jgi:hypothetical protein
MQLRALQLGALSILLASLAFGQQPDRVTEAISTRQMVQLPGNVHALARPQFDVGRADGRQPMPGVALAFQLSPAAQRELDVLVTELQVRNSPNYHKFLTPAQYASRFGLSQNDINKIAAWLRSEGFTNLSVANNRLEVSFDGTVAQIERVFETQIHTYLVNGVLHFANSTDPSVPAALAGTALAMRHLHNFSPKPRVKVQPHLTSYVTGNHYLTPDDFATIYDINPLYNLLPTPITGSGQQIAIVGQSTVSTTDLNNFRSAAGLPASTVDMILVGGNPTRCSGDETESDLDLEWSGGVAKDASIIFVYAGVDSGLTCTTRVNNVFDALQYAIENDVAPFISTSYGACEAANGEETDDVIEGWAEEAVSQGQTITSASGDLGAADCEQDGSTSATTGLAVDMPASIQYVTGAGGNEFTGDVSECPETGCPNNTAPADPPYWAGSNDGSDAVNTALEYIPEEAWNDTDNPLNTGQLISASGGGASIFYPKPSWQTGTGVPNDGARDVPDIAITASDYHDPYLICSEDQSTTSCAVGFRESAGGDFTAVGGTSAAAPTFTAIMALVNQYVGNTPPTGLAPINPTLYTLPGNNPNPFHDVTTGNNIVPCVVGTPDCTTGSFGFSAGVGYDQVTGLGSVDAYNLAQIWARTPTTTDLSASSNNVNVGASVTFTATVSPTTATGTVNFYDNGSTTSLGSGSVSSGTATLTTSSLPQGSDSVTAVYSGDSSDRLSTSAATLVTVTGPDFTIGASPTSVSVGQSATSNPITLTITPTDGFNSQVTFSCSGLPTGATCSAAPVTPNGTSASTTSLTVTTGASTPAGTSTVTITGTGPSTSHTATFSLTVTAVTITLTQTTGGQLQLTQGQNGTVSFNVGPTTFLTGTAPNQQTSSPVTYVCVDPAPETTCTGPGSATQQTSVSFTVVTTAPSAAAVHPFGRGTGILYAILFPGLLGIVFTLGSRRRALGGMRMVGLIVALVFSTLWLGSCSGSNSSSTGNSGTPPNTYTLTVNATAASGATGTQTFTLNVVAQ